MPYSMTPAAPAPYTAYLSDASLARRRPLMMPASTYDGTLAISTLRKTVIRWLADAIRHMPSVEPSSSV